MSMSKKDFIALADALRPFYREEAEHTAETPEEILRAIVLFCHDQNPLFKAQRWTDYLHGKCGPGGKVIKSGAR